MLEEIKKSLNLAFPLITALVAQKVLQLVSIFMLGLLGTNALAAGALTISTYMIFVAAGIGIISAVGALIAQAHGESNNHQTTEYLLQGFYVCVLLAVPCMILFWFIPDLFSWLRQPLLLIPLVRSFFHALLWGFPALLGFFTLREFVSALHFPRIVMKISLVAIPINAVLSYVLAFGKVHLPVLGIAGVGYANAITEWLMFLGLWIFVFSKRLLRDFTKHFAFDLPKWQIIKKILHIGFPSGMSLFFELLMCAVVTMFIGYFGVAPLAAHQIALQCEALAYMFPMGINFAMGIRISHALGANQRDSLLKIIMTGLIIATIFIVLIVVLFLVAPTALIQIFIHPNENNYIAVHHYAVIFLSIAALFYSFDSLQSVFTGYLRGFKDTFVPMMISMLSFLGVAVGGGYLFAFHTSLRVYGLWWGLALGLVSSSILLGLRLYHQLLRH